MKSNQQKGTDGEEDVVHKVRCPHCGKRLQLLPPGFPLYDVQCEGCVFRAQVKTNACKPKAQIFGAGYRMLSHSRHSGQLIPPLIANFRWREKGKACQEIWLYPFLTKQNIRKKVRSGRGSRPGYEEFNYVGLLSEDTPKVILYEKKAPNRAMQRPAVGRRRSPMR